MSKVWIDFHRCEKKHLIFTGKNALRHALFYSKEGRVCDDEQVLYALTNKVRLETAMYWGHGKPETAMVTLDKELVGEGCHAKIYSLPCGDVIYSSQNNGNSPLFEFAILYQNVEKSPRFSKFLKRTFERCEVFRKWYVANGKPFAGKFRGEK